MEKTRKETKIIKVTNGKAMVATKKHTPVKKDSSLKKSTSPVQSKKSSPKSNLKPLKAPVNPIETNASRYLTKHQCLPSVIIYTFLKTSKGSEDLTPAKVNKVLQRMYASGKIQRLHSGVYCTHRFHKNISLHPVKK